mmetsp:Transcript_61454/g.99390  ORF Transcript_61454/g.99390 Transcript_61454/m.99390 type:complete len:219 (-) Transcript_61454:837-1493(-)
MHTRARGALAERRPVTKRDREFARALHARTAQCSLDWQDCCAFDGVFNVLPLGLRRRSLRKRLLLCAFKKLSLLLLLHRRINLHIQPFQLVILFLPCLYIALRSNLPRRARSIEIMYTIFSAGCIHVCVACLYIFGCFAPSLFLLPRFSLLLFPLYSVLLLVPRSLLLLSLALHFFCLPSAEFNLYLPPNALCVVPHLIRCFLLVSLLLFRFLFGCPR